RGGGSDRVVPWEYRVAADGTGADPGNQAGSVSCVVASGAGSRGRPAVQRVLSPAAGVQSLTGFTKESFVRRVERRFGVGSFGQPSGRAVDAVRSRCRTSTASSQPRRAPRATAVPPG